MKSILFTAAGVLIAILTAWALYSPDDLRHKTVGYNDQEIAQAQAEYESTVASTTRELDRQVLETEIERIRLAYGNATALDYEVCHTAPTTAEHKHCAALDKRLKKLLHH